MNGFGRVFWVGLAVGGLMSGAGTARADDGFFSFFQQTFGGGEPAKQAVPVVPSSDAPDSDDAAPPLTVRRHPRRHRSYAAVPVRTPQEILADSKGVTLYTDKTLARGDVVMTVHGLRMFAGSKSWPHTDGDFVAMSSDSKLTPDMRQELKSIDLASRIASRD